MNDFVYVLLGKISVVFDLDGASVCICMQLFVAPYGDLDGMEERKLCLV